MACVMLDRFDFRINRLFSQCRSKKIIPRKSNILFQFFRLLTVIDNDNQETCVF